MKKIRMTPVKRLLAVSCIVVFATVACSITVDLGTSSSSTPTGQVSGEAQVSTMVAQTLQVLTQVALSSTPAVTPTTTLTPTPTNTPLPATLSVSVATNCYAGPSTHYGYVITIRPGVTVTVVGKDTADDYWVIDVPGYPGTVCWMSGQYASVSGDSNNVPAPATPVVSIYTLDEPTNVRVKCDRAVYPTPSGTPPPWWHGGHGWGGSITATLHWRNTDPDQTGIRIYRNGYRIATLGRGATSYSDRFNGWWGHGWSWGDITYGVQVFNSS